MRQPGRNCGGCRFWSEMIARAGGGTTNPRGDTEALCLADKSPHHSKYTTPDVTCPAFAKYVHGIGAMDEPPNYGEGARQAYADLANCKHPNGKPMWAPDGTMLDENGNRSIFDDVDE